MTDLFGFRTTFAMIRFAAFPPGSAARRVTALTLAAASFGLVLLAARTPNALAQKRFEVALPEGTVLEPGSVPVVSSDGQLGFVAPSKGDTIVVFGVRTGEIVARIPDLGAAGGIAVHETGERRLLLVSLAGDPADDRGPAVKVFDATDPADPKLLSTFELPVGAAVVPGSRADVVRSGRVGVVAITSPVPALLSFDLETGQQLGALTLDGVPDIVSVLDAREDARIAVVSAASNKVSVISLSDIGVLLPLSAFEPPPDAPLSPVNNVVFDATGVHGYVASTRGRALMSFSLESGELLGRLPTDGSSGRVAVYHDADRDLIAVVNLSRPGGRAPSLEPDAADPFGLPGAVIANADADGRLEFQSKFYPEMGDEIAPSNNVDFSADGRSLFVPARTGSLYVVDTVSGVRLSREKFDGRVQSIAAAPLAEAVAVVSAGGDAGRLDIVPVLPNAAPPDEDVPDGTGGSEPEGREHGRDREAASKEREPAAPMIERLNPSSIQTGRRRDLPITIAGSGFVEGATVVAAGDVYSAVVSKNSKRVNFTLSSERLTATGAVPIQVRNPDGTLSNVVELQVVPPLVPALIKVSPAKIESGAGPIDLDVRGDHFRDGAIVKVAYTDPDGTVRIVDLKSYRLSFTQIVARLPRKLTVRARDLSVSVLDRDGSTISQVLPVHVVGPSVATITPDRAVAGDLKADATLVVHLDGANFHRDAAVYVKRPVRGDGEPATFRQLSSSSVKWRTSTKMSIRLSSADVSLSGDLTIRVINPVPGERRRLGDAADVTFTVAGPVIASVEPSAIVAGSDAFVLKLEGTDFRRGAVVKFTRTDGSGEVTKRVSIEDPSFKDRRRINIRMDTPELLRLVARPGTLAIRVLNPNAGKGDPSPSVTVSVVSPEVTAFTLLPRADDPTQYKLTLTGSNFRDGATVQVLTANGEPVGGPHDARFNDATEIVVILGRARLTELRTFQVVVINPGGTYNGSGVRSAPFPVAVQ